MKNMFSCSLPPCIIILCLSLSWFCQAGNVDIRIHCDQPTVPISPVLYGIFFEDINFAADGGLYAELIQNRSFEYYPVEGGNPLSDQYHTLYAWEKVERDGGQCRLSVDRGIPLNRNNPNYLTIRIEQTGSGVGVMNEGYDGIRIDTDKKYDISFYARRSGRQNAAITAALELADGTVCGSVNFEGIGVDWQKYEGVITSKSTSDKARLVLTTPNRGPLYLDMISLFPQDTFKKRKNGLRADLAQALADLKPKFFRFPGGCITHGHSLQNAYRWKDTVGDVAERLGNWNRWGYHQTYGLGYFEYFQLCEDIGAAPLPVLPVGVSCGFNQPYQCVPMDELQPWIDDAIDLIEFANGPANSRWGKIRAEMGHPQPFGLEYVCLGNEEHDRPEFHERFPHFVKAIRESHPEIKIIGTSGLGTGIPLYSMMADLNVYSSDEHYYMNPQWFLANQNRFDTFDRSLPKIFVGEYASEGNSLFNAIAEAAFLTGVERNGDIVDMTCYAPLFAHVDHTQWPRADLIWFDKRTVVKTPNYYVQQLFSCNSGHIYLKNSVTQILEDKIPTIKGAIGIGAWSTAIEMNQASVNGAILDPSQWRAVSGNFRMQNNHYVQLDTTQQPAISFAPIKYQDDKITYTVRARKTGGSEGFLLVFGCENDQSYWWWNVGGWNNTQHAIERIENGKKSVLTERRGSIRNDTWYTMKVELTPGRIQCFLDGQLIHDYEMQKPSISVSSTLDKKSHEVIVKLVNPTDEVVKSIIHLDGVSGLKSPAKLMLLSGQASARNSIQNLDQIKTQTRQITVDKQFGYTLPAMSVQFIRISTQ